MSGVTIRPARPADFERLGAMFARAQLGGPTMAAQMAFARERLGGEAFVADAGGELVGASAAVAFGVNGWIGGVAVLPERRGAGLGSALTTAAADWLATAGVRTASLHATAMGRPVYERLGFATDGRWLRLTLPAEAAPAQTAWPVPARRSVGVRAGGDGDLEAVLALDRAVTGEDRARLLHAVWGSGCLVAEDGDGQLAGFHARKPVGEAGGATIARDERAGAALLAAWQRAGTGADVVLPEANQAGHGALEALGYRVAGATTLMRRGPGPAHRPLGIFGGFNLFWS